MAGRARTGNHGAGGATGSSRSSSPARGLSVVDGARPPTDADMLAALDGLTPKVEYGPRCGVAHALGLMTPDVRVKVASLLDESNIPASKIADVLAEFGYPNLYRSITRHRRRKTSPSLGCRCE